MSYIHGGELADYNEMVPGLCRPPVVIWEVELSSECSMKRMVTTWDDETPTDFQYIFVVGWSYELSFPTTWEFNQWWENQLVKGGWVIVNPQLWWVCVNPKKYPAWCCFRVFTSGLFVMFCVLPFSRGCMILVDIVGWIVMSQVLHVSYIYFKRLGEFGV